MKIAGLILAKSDSRRLHNKNTLDFGGIPMFLVNVIKCVDIFDKVYVSSDSEDILDWADSRGAIAIKRPIELCGDIPNIPVYKHAMQFMDCDALVAVQANSPNINPEVIKDVKKAMEHYDEVMTVHSDGKIYGSVWGITRDKLMKRTDVYEIFNPEPEYKVVDFSIDVHTKKDYQLALEMHGK